MIINFVKEIYKKDKDITYYIYGCCIRNKGVKLSDTMFITPFAFSKLVKNSYRCDNKVTNNGFIATYWLSFVCEKSDLL